MSHIATGIVTSTNMKNTVTVRVMNKLRHPVYRKVIVKHRKFKAHNEMSDINVGDTVEIKEVKPISKTVHFIVTKKI